MEPIGLIWKASLMMYVRCSKEATQGLIKNWPLLIGSAVLVIVHQIAMGLLGQFGIVGGFILGIMQICFMTLYLGWMRDTLERDTLRLKSLFVFDAGLFFNVISVAFIISIFGWILQQLTLGMNAGVFLAAVNLVLVILLNSIPEVIYIHRMESLNALQHAFQFTKDNWIEWFLPFLICLLPILTVSAWAIPIIISMLNPLFPPFAVVLVFLYASPAYFYFLIPVIVICANWYMLFRGHLFKELETGSRRRRIYNMRMT